MVLSKTATFAALPPPFSINLLPSITAKVAEAGHKLIVLDDDPTGTQTVHDVPVLTTWTPAILATELRDPAPLVYILVNSRSLPTGQAVTLIESLMANLRTALTIVPRPVDVISRSDSTLRGHFPEEVDTIRRNLPDTVDGVLLIPAFFDGGRYTLNDIHYVAEGESLVPAAQTEYARDNAFGYKHSNLREWIAEKYGSLPIPSTISISLDTLRRKGPVAVTEQLFTVNDGAYVIVNAVDYRDLEVFVTGLSAAEIGGKRFITRSAASYVRVRAGIAPRGLLTTAELRGDSAAPGLIVAGSYIAKSSAQIAQALDLPDVIGVEVEVGALLNSEQQFTEISRVIEAIVALHRAGQTGLIYTSRELVTGSDAHSSLQIGQRISAALVEIVRRLPYRPGWIVAKGGITSSDIATAALGITRAWVVGQALPGIPVWRADPDSLWPGITYIVFPGNVGNESALADVIRRLTDV